MTDISPFCYAAQSLNPNVQNFADFCARLGVLGLIAVHGAKGLFQVQWRSCPALLAQSTCITSLCVFSLAKRRPRDSCPDSYLPHTPSPRVVPLRSHLRPAVIELKPPDFQKPGKTKQRTAEQSQPGLQCPEGRVGDLARSVAKSGLCCEQAASANLGGRAKASKRLSLVSTWGRLRGNPRKSKARAQSLRRCVPTC